jgi:hypothetical protein
MEVEGISSKILFLVVRLDNAACLPHGGTLPRRLKPKQAQKFLAAGDGRLEAVSWRNRGQYACWRLPIPRLVGERR